MKELIKKFITEEDIELIDSITGKSIKAIIDSHDLNEFNSNKKHVVSVFDEDGIHLLRCILAEKIFNYKRLNLEGNEYTDKFLCDGILVLDPAVDHETFLCIMKYITTNQNYDVSPSWVNKTRKDMVSDYDIQYTMHVDTFHPCFKVFRYNNDIELEHGPYSYVLGSNKNSKEKLTVLYELSKRRTHNLMLKNVTRNSNHVLWTDSLRLAIAEDYCINTNQINEYLLSYGFREETPIIGKKGSVIITDTSGFHRRYPTIKGYVRHSSRLVLERPNPFLI